jgi:hypothetical protein
MKKSALSAVVFVISMVLFSACVLVATPVPPTLKPLPSQTPVPTETLVPTNTTIPTYTLAPTLTPTATVPAPDKVMEYLNGVQVTYFDTFNDPKSLAWWLGSGEIKNGVLVAFGNSNWNGVGRDVDRKFREREGLIIDFTFTKGSVFEMILDYGDWQTDPYRRFGAYVMDGSAKADLFQGVNGLGFNNLDGNFGPRPDTNYSILMAVLPGGEFLAVIWNPADPSQTIYYREKVGAKWADLTWKFTIGANSGTIQFDNYREIKFDAAK